MSEVTGTYSIEGDRVVITFHRSVPFITTITLRSSESVLDLATDVLPSSTIYTLPDGSDPLRMTDRSFVELPASLALTTSGGA